ncbi:MAG: two-component regulator propeller domain-containing protein [Clostridiales bacterium]|nr:two-component regulator propeller domain-containing protein [Clostridiales bacterium]
MEKKKRCTIGIFVIGCILTNYFGKALSDYLALPVWLDSIGTVFTAYVLGPVCGAIVGVASNIMYGLHSRISLFYGLTNLVVGVTVGICAKKGFLKDLFGVLSTAFLVTLLSVFISVPLNFVLADGATGNIWGDGVAGYLQELGCNKEVSYMIGEFYLDFADKVITMLILFVAVRLLKKRNWKKRSGKKVVTMLLLVSMLTCLVPGSLVCAENHSEEQETKEYDSRKYVQTVYNKENGLPGGSANDIVQTKDGVLWIGTYGGLYRYSGNSFQWMREFDSVKTVNCLYEDEAGRLWIGTNDNGLSISINQNISNVVKKEDGLPSNSVRCIVQNTEGYYYVGTTDGLAVMQLSGGLKVHKIIPEVVYADSICADQRGNVAAVTNEGGLYLIRGNKVIMQKTMQKEGASYNCCTFDENETLYVGTSANTIETYRIIGEHLEKLSSIECGSLLGINSLTISEDHTMFICADNGAGYMPLDGEYSFIDTDTFNSSIEHMLIDYQGNLWFASSRLGLLRLCPSVFQEIYEKYGMDEKVVNSVIKWKDCMFFGTDSGLDIVSEEPTTKLADSLVRQLEGVRIRCLMVDSKNHLWICTSGRGIWEIKEHGKITVYDSKTGAIGDKFRSVIQMKDGTMVVAGDSGLTFIRDGKVCDTIGIPDGLSNPKVLTLHEREDGSILAGTDGNGIAVITDGKVKETLKQEDGLSSDIVLRMVPDSDGGGLFVVTGNGLCYMTEEGDVRILSNFPYYNNYDVVEGKNGELFALGSAGIYVLDKKSLLKGKEVSYELLDAKKGLRKELTPNSWNYIDEEDNLYMSGETGVVCMNLNHYNISVRSYRMLLKEIVVDGESVLVEKGETTYIPRGSCKIEINPEIVNYSIEDPNVRVYLEGFDQKPKVVAQSELSNIVYTNLASGEYTFHLAVLESRTGNVIAENTYRIVKETEIYDNWWFQLYVAVEAVIVIAYLTWMFIRTQIQKSLRIQKMELEWAKKQLQMGNETIMTIAKTVDAKDENTSQHSVRVSEYSVMIAKRLGYSEEACEELRKIAMLHDIGKIGIPDYVLNKPAKLTDEEYEIMKSHVSRGAEILKNFTLIDHVTEGALYHHERYDGRGYIHGLKGEEIPLNARIIGLADAFDAMTANRVYRKQLDFQYVLEELKKGRGTQFDPKLVDIMLGLIEDGTIDVKQIYKTAGSEVSR